MNGDNFTLPPYELIEESISWVERFAQHLEQAQLGRLLDVVKNHSELYGNGDLAVDDEAFDIGDEIRMLIKAVRGLRRNVMTDSGHMLGENDTRDVKEVISSSTHLFSLLLKAQEKIDHMSRMQSIEEAAVAAVRTLPDDAQDAFFEVLEKRLGEDAPNRQAA